MSLETTPESNKPAPKRYPDNPGGDDYEKMTLEDGPFFFTHTHISDIRPNHIVAAKELGPHAQVERLVRTGAISEASDDHADAYKEHLAATQAPRLAASQIDPAVPPKEGVTTAIGADDNARKPEDPKAATPTLGGLNQPPKSGDKK